MVSKASDDLPEPDKPVNTTSLFARNIQVDVLQIVLARAANDYRALAGGTVLALRPDHFIHIGISRRDCCATFGRAPPENRDRTPMGKLGT